MTRSAPGSAGRLNTIDVERLEALLADGRAVLIDVREPGEHRAERIPDAVCVPLSRFDAESVAEHVPDAADRPLVLHCASGNRSRQAAQRLLDAGWNEVTHLGSGLRAWKQAGKATLEDPGAPIALERQVRIAAGSLVFLGVVLGLLWTPWAFALSAFVGAGLVFSGVTDTCGMGLLLSKLWFNQR